MSTTKTPVSAYEAIWEQEKTNLPSGSRSKLEPMVTDLINRAKQVEQNDNFGSQGGSNS